MVSRHRTYGPLLAQARRFLPRGKRRRPPLGASHPHALWLNHGADANPAAITYPPTHLPSASSRPLPASAIGSRVLVPGAGLCRLAVELSEDLGLHVTAMDSSLLMLSAAHSLLQRAPSSPPLTFYPWLHDPLLNQPSLATR